MARYYEYHAGPYGYGYIRKGNSIPLATGIYTHTALAGILELSRNGEVPERKDIRDVISTTIERYHRTIESRGLLNLDGQDDVKFITNEQATLIEGLVWGWVRVWLPRILDEFEIVDIEREESLQLEDNIVQLSRPDIVLRRKVDGKLGIHDFKTTASLSDSYVEEFKSSVQMAVGTVAVERRLNEPVDHYYVHALLKGGRKPFTRKEQKTGRRQYSIFCYAKVSPANPPLTKKTTYDLGGYWIDKTPIWEVDFKESDKRPAEAWVDLLKDSELFEQYALIGPYDRQDALIESYFSGVVGEEQSWINRLWELNAAAKRYGDTSEEFYNITSRLFPRSWDCHKYGVSCPFIPLCFRYPGWQDPIGSGLYTHRRPHHVAEIEQMRTRGIPVPEEEGEESES